MKRGVPSDSAISPSVTVAAQTKSLHHGEDQRRVKSAKRLSYGEILPKPNPGDVIFWSTEMPRVNCIQFDNLAASRCRRISEWTEKSKTFPILLVGLRTHLGCRLPFLVLPTVNQSETSLKLSRVPKLSLHIVRHFVHNDLTR